MCTYLTEKIEVAGSGKGAGGLVPLTDATVYFDHPAARSAEHTLNIDFLNPGERPVRPGRGGADRRVGQRAGAGDRGDPGIRAARARSDFAPVAPPPRRPLPVLNRVGRARARIGYERRVWRQWL